MCVDLNGRHRSTGVLTSVFVMLKGVEKCAVWFCEFGGRDDCCLLVYEAVYSDRYVSQFGGRDDCCLLVYEAVYSDRYVSQFGGRDDCCLLVYEAVYSDRYVSEFGGRDDCCLLVYEAVYSDRYVSQFPTNVSINMQGAIFLTTVSFTSTALYKCLILYILSEIHTYKLYYQQTALGYEQRTTTCFGYYLEHPSGTPMYSKRHLHR
jgi:hypothetical protein